MIGTGAAWRCSSGEVGACRARPTSATARTAPRQPPGSPRRCGSNGKYRPAAPSHPRWHAPRARSIPPAASTAARVGEIQARHDGQGVGTAARRVRRQRIVEKPPGIRQLPALGAIRPFSAFTVIADGPFGIVPPDAAREFLDRRLRPCRVALLDVHARFAEEREGERIGARCRTGDARGLGVELQRLGGSAPPAPAFWRDWR